MNPVTSNPGRHNPKGIIMKKKIIALAFAGTSLGVFASAPTASAAHCVETNEPGFSYFGTDHVQEEGHEGRDKHAGTSGASNCNDDVNPSPSTRAPGRNR